MHRNGSIARVQKKKEFPNNKTDVERERKNQGRREEINSRAEETLDSN